MNTRILVRRLTSGIAIASMAALAACVPPEGQNKAPDVPKQVEEPPAPQDEDITLDGFETAEIKGTVFRPGALGNPSMVRVSPRKKTTLDKQRKKFAKEKAAAKATDAKILVTMLWDSARANQDPAQAKALLDEAKQVLATTKSEAGDAYDAILYRMEFTLLLWGEEEAAAVPVGTEMVAKYPEDNITDALAPWIAYVQLRADKVEDAKQTVSRWSLDQLDANSDYPRAYVMAWTAFRAANYDQSTPAIVWAAKNWKSSTTVPNVVQDLLLMLSRAGTPIDQVSTYFADLSGGNQDVQYEWFYKLYEGYEFSGYPKLASASLEKALSIKGKDVPPMHLVSISQRQFNNLLVAHEPKAAADKLVAAYQGIGPCGEPCAANSDAMADQIKQLAQHFHTTYATTHDDKFYGPAEQLYQFYIGLGRPDAANMQSNLTNLQETKKRMVVNTGRHDQTTMAWSTGVRNNAIKACYEQVLQSQVDLMGEVSATLEIAADGSVAGVTTKPAAGETGLAAVGACVDKRARQWTFPSRTKPGKTTLTLVYKLSPEAPASPAKP